MRRQAELCGTERKQKPCYTLGTAAKRGGLRRGAEACGSASLTTFNLGAVGSSPTGLTMQIKGFPAWARAGPRRFPRPSPEIIPGHGRSPRGTGATWPARGGAPRAKTTRQGRRPAGRRPAPARRDAASPRRPSGGRRGGEQHVAEPLGDHGCRQGEAGARDRLGLNACDGWGAAGLVRSAGGSTGSKSRRPSGRLQAPTAGRLWPKNEPAAREGCGF